MSKSETLLTFLNELNANGRIQYDDYSRLFDLASEMEAVYVNKKVMQMGTKKLCSVSTVKFFEGGKNCVQKCEGSGAQERKKYDIRRAQ